MNTTRRNVLAGLVAGIGSAGAGAAAVGALGAFVRAASARAAAEGYTFPGPAPDRGLGLSPPSACTPGTRT